MMSISEMVYELDLRADRLSSKNRMNLPVPAKVALLNSAQLAVIKDKVSGEPGAQQIRKRTEETQLLERIEIPLEAKLFVVSEQLFQANLPTGKETPLQITRMYARAVSDKCKSVGQFRVKLLDTQSDDIEIRKFDTHTEPSLRFRRGLVRTAENKILVYAKDFRVTEVVIDYYRYPAKMEMKGYKRFNGEEILEDVNCEMPLSVQEDILNEAVVNVDLHMKSKDVQLALAQRQRTDL
jgi:hypothetical protein